MTSGWWRAFLEGHACLQQAGWEPGGTAGLSLRAVAELYQGVGRGLFSLLSPSGLAAHLIVARHLAGKVLPAWLTLIKQLQFVSRGDCCLSACNPWCGALPIPREPQGSASGARCPRTGPKQGHQVSSSCRIAAPWPFQHQLARGGERELSCWGEERDRLCSEAKSMSSQVFLGVATGGISMSCSGDSVILRM